jgi:hypothetical protein
MPYRLGRARESSFPRRGIAFGPKKALLGGVVVGTCGRRYQGSLHAILTEGPRRSIEHSLDRYLIQATSVVVNVHRV